MLTKIKIQNFQAHEKAVVDLDPVTTFVGPSDVGKSAFIRSLQWACLNQPSGSAFIREGAPGASVKIEAEDHVIGRLRSGSRNEYTLDGKEMVAFGSTIPEPITGTLRVTEENFQGQHDPPFWLSLSAGEVSRKLNAVVDLSDIDRSLSALAKETRSRKIETNLLRGQVKQAKERRDALEWVTDADRDYQTVEELDAERSRTAARVTRLGGLVSDVEELETSQERRRVRLEDTKSVGLAMQRALTVKQKAAKLREMIVSMQTLSELADMEQPDVEGLDQLAGKLRRIQKKVSDLSNLIRATATLRGRIEEDQEVLAEVETEIKNMPTTNCPTCGRPF